MVHKHPLLHRETLLIVPTTNPEHIPLPLIAKLVAFHLLTHLLIVEMTEAVLILEFNGFLLAGFWV
jgi:hypothetical protein